MLFPYMLLEPYLNAVLEALSLPVLTRTPFNVQALMILAITQYHNLKNEGQALLNLAVSFAIELGMNQRGFAQTFGESQPVLEES
jgi:hypothetical protein